jgi:hypothetical protein
MEQFRETLGAPDSVVVRSDRECWRYQYEEFQVVVLVCQLPDGRVKARAVHEFGTYD